MREAHNLEAYVEWFNRLSYLVAAEIVRHDSKKARIKALEFFIQVGHECHLQHNFNSLMAIISALNFASIARLKKTWDKLPSKNHQLYLQLEVRLAAAEEGFALAAALAPRRDHPWFPRHQSTLDPSGNFRNYREEMSSLMHSSDVVPFFSLMVKVCVRARGCAGVWGVAVLFCVRVFRRERTLSRRLLCTLTVPALSLQDVYFTKEAGGGKRLANGHINFESMWRYVFCRGAALRAAHKTLSVTHLLAPKRRVRPG